MSVSLINQGKIVVRVRVVRCQPDGRAIVLDRFRVVTLIVVKIAQIEMGQGIFRVDGQGGPVVRFCFAEGPRVEVDGSQIDEGAGGALRWTKALPTFPRLPWPVRFRFRAYGPNRLVPQARRV